MVKPLRYRYLQKKSVVEVEGAGWEKPEQKVKE